MAVRSPGRSKPGAAAVSHLRVPGDKIPVITRRRRLFVALTEEFPRMDTSSKGSFLFGMGGVGDHRPAEPGLPGQPPQEYHTLVIAATLRGRYARRRRCNCPAESFQLESGCSPGTLPGGGALILRQGDSVIIVITMIIRLGNLRLDTYQ